MTNTLPSFAKSTSDEKRLCAYPMVGLNADWCCAAWQINDNTVIFDNEDDTADGVGGTYSVLIYTENEKDGTRDIEDAYNGSIAECLNYLEAGQ